MSLVGPPLSTLPYSPFCFIFISTEYSPLNPFDSESLANVTLLVSFLLQKARLARIRMAKNTAGAAFLNSKKKMQERMAARESGLEVDADLKDGDVFEIQHHHLLNCLEKTTVSTAKGVGGLGSADTA